MSKKENPCQKDKVTCEFCHKKVERLYKTETFGKICAECWAKIFIGKGGKSGKAPRKWFGR